MAYLALYRKYRPSTFDGLIGQEHVVKTLVNQIISGRLGHAYLFTGTRGTGKTSAAKIFARAINCTNPKNGSPCGRCEACKALADPSNIDVIEIDAASNNGVNEIRELREKVQYPPVSCRYKVYIVDEVHMLTGAAFNALLKTLEEPPKHAVFILATTEVHKIPATILSRCMRFDFRLINTDRIAELISNIYDEQGKQYEKEAVYAIAKAGEGSIRDALSIADIALSYGEGILTYDDVTDILGTSNFDVLAEFISVMIDGNVGNVLKIIDKLCALGKSTGVLTKDVTAFIRDLLVVKTCENADEILSIPEAKFNTYKALSARTNEDRLLRILEIFSKAETDLKYTNHPRVVFETAAVKASKPEADYDIDAIMSRIKTIEEKINKGTFVKAQTSDNVLINAVDVSESKAEPKVEVKSDIARDVRPLSEMNAEELKGTLLTGVRRIGSEMLWSLLQHAQLELKGYTLNIVCSSASDFELMDQDNSKRRLKDAVEELKGFDIEVFLTEEEKTLDEIDDASDRIKKIFGDDIVVIK